MYQIMNWLCLTCISFLMFEIMVYFCKDAIKIFNSSENKTRKPIANTKAVNSSYTYESKIAK